MKGEGREASFAHCTSGVMAEAAPAALMRSYVSLARRSRSIELAWAGVRVQG